MIVTIVTNAERASALMPPVTRRWLTQGLASLGVVVALAVYIGCGASSPPPLDCDTQPETRSYFLDTGCGVGGPVTVTTTPNDCKISVDGGYAAQIPSVGAFTAPGADGEFTLEEGNWQLQGSVRFAFHPPVDETLTCTAGPVDPTTNLQPLNCAASICSDDGEDSSCEEQLCNAFLYPPGSRPPVSDGGGSLGLGLVGDSGGS